MRIEAFLEHQHQHQHQHLEKISGTVERITYHNEQNGWSVLKVASFKAPERLTTVLIHQAKVFAGATMEFWGQWSHHPKHGEQFKAIRSLEKKPATTAALEKYLGSGLIKGVGPATAKKIVSHFKDRTLDVFEHAIVQLTSVPGIAQKKLETIRTSWDEHKAIRDVMMFLQDHGLSTLFATKIYKTYGDESISRVSENPYRLAQDIYGIGFFSADKIALGMGFLRKGELRIEAGIKHVLASSREEGHCFLTKGQIINNTLDLLNEDIPSETLGEVLTSLRASNQVKVRTLEGEECFYSKGLYYSELKTAEIVHKLLGQHVRVDSRKVSSWVSKYCHRHDITLSDEQREAVCAIPGKSFSILTGGPGCGKTTCTKVLVNLLMAMGRKVTLAAPTGRAAQRMTEVMGVGGLQAKTIHRLLEWSPYKKNFKFDENNPIQTNFLILDEVSMLDISLASSLLLALPKSAQALFIGDPDQLPAVGAGSVLFDLLRAASVPRFRLTRVFRQAQKSSIIRFAHEINEGKIPPITSPLKEPQAFSRGVDCLFVDAEEATREQLAFMRRMRSALDALEEGKEGYLLKLKEQWEGKIEKTEEGHLAIDRLYRPPPKKEEGEEEEDESSTPVLSIPEKFRHVDFQALSQAKSEVEQLMSVLKTIHPWSTLKYGLTAVETTVRLYTKSIPQWFHPRKEVEIQVLGPQIRGTMGVMNLNQVLQRVSNPESPHKRQLQFSGKLLRTGDRVIQTRNNYDLGIFNGDIGKIEDVDVSEVTCTVRFSGSGTRLVTLKKDDLSDLQLAYGITIHKSQGSEFEVVIIPLVPQHYTMLFRNLLYTGLTRAKKLAVFVGSRKSLAQAVKRIDQRERQTALTHLVDELSGRMVRGRHQNRERPQPRKSGDSDVPML